jgi:uncharacterized protein (TIGR04255 family)
VNDAEHSARPVDFESPPLNEVTFSLQFDEDVADELLALSRFAPRVHDEFPNLEKQPPVPKATERFEVPPPEIAPQVQLLTGPPTGRYWFVSDDGTQLAQVQADRFMFNWRQVKGDESYPHFDVLYPKFKQLVQTFDDVVSTAKAPIPYPSWCELVYTNVIEAEGDTPGTHGQLARILNYLVEDPHRATLPPVEDTQIQQRFRLTDDDGEPYGRLYVSAVPGFRKTDGRPVYVLTLHARGRAPAGSMPESLDSFFDRAHLLIVKGFREVTTPAMHERWKEKEV